MTFVERNDYDLLDTLLDLNASIFQEYEYKQGATNVFTTAFDVYANRRPAPNATIEASATSVTSRCPPALDMTSGCVKVAPALALEDAA